MNPHHPEHPDPHHPDRPEPGHPGAGAGSGADSGWEVVRLHGPGHLITTAAYLLGFHPDEPSLVVIGLQDRRLDVVARLDLPALTNLDAPTDLAGAWEVFAPALGTSSPETVAILAYTDPTWVTALHAFVISSPLPVSEVARVHAGRWHTLVCPHTGPTPTPIAGAGPGSACGHPECSPGGAPIPQDPAVTAPLIATGSPIPGTRADLAAALAPGPADLLTEVTDRLHHQPARTRTALLDAVREAHDARTGGPDPLLPGQAAVLLSAVNDLVVRDACLTWTDDAAWWLWHDLLHAAPPGRIAPVATLIALLAYQRGDGVTADIATGHALADDPGYGLAQLLRESLHRALPPEAITAVITDALANHPLTRPPDTGP